MRLTCPSCAAEYEIEPGAIGARGRRVRCASCAKEWFQEAPVASVAEAAAAVDAARTAAREREMLRASGRETDRDAVLPPEPERPITAPEPPAIEGEPGEAARSEDARAARNLSEERRLLAMAPDEFAASLRAGEDADHGPRAGAAFLAGFATVAVLALILFAIYVKRAEIADLVPSADAPLAAYADLVDQGRAALAGLVGG
ncbi:hypothetical protein G5B40_04505 [Pikeienuella piscinae]|uniref:Zinc finger/thioredoxin putative domain-containing protein n=1 Tax=Pikeienuella piscinae TaxID=2748098 RepID=A0A7L5BWZ7_9RHOB|nr:zinc-ribbon domain-containing protein [Pikeienuella piscinae]QIE54766.1 hypothetical protein G5B40_04505 [Pikeienuella piscinae]